MLEKLNEEYQNQKETGKMIVSKELFDWYWEFLGKEYFNPEKIVFRGLRISHS